MQLNIPTSTNPAAAAVNASSKSTSAANFPATGSYQVVSTAGTPRGKVALGPGCSLMDWIRLGKSGEDLVGLGGARVEVTPSELARHSTPDDCWIAVRGVVYNISRYLRFHPGGEDELMRGAGIDATDLFNQIHRWVNIDSMLSPCLVGKLVSEIGTTNSRRRSSQTSVKSLALKTASPISNGNVTSLQSLNIKVPSTTIPPRYEWLQNDASLTLVVYTKWCGMRSENVSVDKLDNTFAVRLFVATRCYKIVLEKNISSLKPCPEVKVYFPSGKTEIIFQKLENNHLSSFDKISSNQVSIDCSEETCFRQHTITSVEKVTHDTNLYRVSVPADCSVPVPVGYHVKLKASVNGMEIVRSYTAVPDSLESKPDKVKSQGRHLNLLIKIYQDGLVTPIINDLEAGSDFVLSHPEGTFDVSKLDDCKRLVLCAAGTGFTPMSGILNYTLSNDKCLSITLLFFNKTEKDIIWREQLNSLKEKHQRLNVLHVLSRADASWTGLRGHIDSEHLSSLITTPYSETYFCICGPTEFTKRGLRLVENLGLPSDRTHAFLG